MANRREAVAIVHPPSATPVPALPPTGRLLYAVHLTNQRRGAGYGAVEDGVDMSLGPGGNRFVVDRWNRRVTEFGPDGGPVAQWGDARTLASPVAAAADERGLLVVDHEARAIVEFDRDRRPVAVRRWTELGLGLPRSIAIDGDGRIAVGDESPAAIHLFDRDFARLGRPLDGAASPERVRGFRPFEVRFAPDGTIVAYEAQGQGRIRRFGLDGADLGEWRDALRDGKLAVAPNGDVWVGGPHGRGLVRYGPNGERRAEIAPQSILGGLGEGGVGGLAVTDDAVYILWRHGFVGTYRLLP